MKASLKRKWVMALRNGKYKQGNGRLYDPKTRKYCCLGVLGRCARARIVDSWRGILTDSLAEEIGVTEDEQRGLAKKNDSGHWSFNRIATWIEANL